METLVVQVKDQHIREAEKLRWLQENNVNCPLAIATRQMFPEKVIVASVAFVWIDGNPWKIEPEEARIAFRDWAWYWKVVKPMDVTLVEQPKVWEALANYVPNKSVSEEEWIAKARESLQDYVLPE